MPVGLPAAVVYGAICVALWAAVCGSDARRRLRAWYVLIPLATLVLASASWFSALQLLAVGRVCGFCLAVHGCAILLALVLFWHIPHDWRSAAERDNDPIGLPPTATLGLVLLGLVGLAGVVVGQVFSKAPMAQAEIIELDSSASESAGNQSVDSRGTPSTGKAQQEPIDLSDEFPPPPPDAASAGSAPRRLRLLNGKLLVDVTRLPILGQWDAKTVAIELFDYTCPHCRRTHRLLAEARNRYGRQLALAVIVTPMDPKCNPYVTEPAAASAPPPCDLARFSVAVWQTKPEAFEAYHDWMMGSPEIPTVEAARARAAEILGADKLAQALASPAIAQQLAADNRLYHLLGEGQIPKLLTDRLIVTGEPDDAGKLFDLLEKQNGLLP
jgi:protein-disulfide isomerase